MAVGGLAGLPRRRIDSLSSNGRRLPSLLTTVLAPLNVVHGQTTYVGCSRQTRLCRRMPPRHAARHGADCRQGRPAAKAALLTPGRAVRVAVAPAHPTATPA